MICVTWDWKASNWKGVRKPREPRWKAMTGGTLSCIQQGEGQHSQRRYHSAVGPGRLHTWKSEDAYSRVPSPPRQMMKSTRLEMSSRSGEHKHL